MKALVVTLTLSFGKSSMAWAPALLSNDAEASAPVVWTVQPQRPSTHFDRLLVDTVNSARRSLRDELQRLIRTTAPALVEAFGVGPDTAAALLIAAGSNSDRLHSEAAFASLCGVSPYRHHPARPTGTGSIVVATARPMRRYIE